MNATTPDVSSLEPRSNARTIWRGVASALVGGLLIAGMEFAVTHASVDDHWYSQFAWLLRLAVHWAMATVPLGLAIALAEIRAVDRVPSIGRYAVAVAAGATAGGLVLALHSKFLDTTISETAVGADLPLADRFLYGLWQFAFWGSVGALLHAYTSRQSQGAAALRAGALDRMRSENELANAQLAALHAHVEPEFLLGALDRIEALYGRDAARADRALDALIGFLREAMPLLRRGTSSLHEECRLLRTYVNAAGAGELGPVNPQFDVPQDLGSIGLPSGGLLPVVQGLLGTVADGGEAAELTVRATRIPDGPIGIDVLVAPARVDEAALGRIQAAAGRLRAACGPGASVELRHGPQFGLTLTLAKTNIGTGVTNRERRT